MLGLSPREEIILQKLRSGEEYPVTRLSEELGVSAVTIRADIRNLDAKGLVVRHHGKVVVASAPQTAIRDGANAAQKEAIAAWPPPGKRQRLHHDHQRFDLLLIPRYLFGKAEDCHQFDIAPAIRASQSQLHITSSEANTAVRRKHWSDRRRSPDRGLPRFHHLLRHRRLHRGAWLDHRVGRERPSGAAHVRPSHPPGALCRLL